MSAGNEDSDEDEYDAPDKVEEENFSYWSSQVDNQNGMIQEEAQPRISEQIHIDLGVKDADETTFDFE